MIETGWTQGTGITARDKSGQWCAEHCEKAVCWTLEGAVLYMFQLPFDPKCRAMRNKICDLFNEEIKPHEDIIAFNDDPNTTKEDVIRVINRVKNKIKQSEGQQ